MKTIKYKVNKTSDSVSCTVNNIELIEQDLIRVDNERTLIKFNKYLKELFEGDIIEVKEFNTDSLDTSIKEYDLFEKIETISSDVNMYKGRESSYSRLNLLNGYSLEFTLVTTRYGVDCYNFEGFLTKEHIKVFTNEVELKSYVNSIKEDISFITDSDIDQVLLKEWLGEWEYKRVSGFELEYELNHNLKFIDVYNVFPLNDFIIELKAKHPEIDCNKLTKEDIIKDYKEFLESSKDVTIRLNSANRYNEFTGSGVLGWVFYIKNNLYFIGENYEQIGEEIYTEEDIVNEKYIDKTKIYQIDCGLLKSGSPKLPSNWTFKIN